LRVGTGKSRNFSRGQCAGELQSKVNELDSQLRQVRELPGVTEVRQCGFIAGIELDDAEAANEVCRRACDYGLLTRNIRETIVLMPPLCTTDEQLERAVSALTEAMEKIELEGRALSRPGRDGGRPSMSRP